MKYKILYISAVVPDTTSGGRFAMYRHLIIKNDFEIAVASTNSIDLPIFHKFSIRRNRLIERIRRTRLCRLVYNLEYIVNWFYLPNKLLSFAINFKPNAILCVVDDWHIGLAYQVAKYLNIPLIVNFQDLFCLSKFVHQSSRPYKIVTPWLIRKYYYVNKIASHSFYTSEGMKEWFDVDAKGDVLYPVGDFGVKIKTQLSEIVHPKMPLNVIYAGNCYGAYGRMLLRLAQSAKGNKDIRLHIFASANDWSKDQVKEMSDAGIYHGFQPFDKLQKCFSQSDAFLTVMSFEKEDEAFMKTSFTTKWLEYVPYGKPVFVWAPEYSTAFRFSRQHQSGVTVFQDDPEALLKSIYETALSSTIWHSVCEGSLTAAETVLNAEAIHSLFVEKVTNCIKKVSFNQTS